MVTETDEGVTEKAGFYYSRPISTIIGVSRTPLFKTHFRETGLSQSGKAHQRFV